jgi:hypothetical protein
MGLFFGWGSRLFCRGTAPKAKEAQDATADQQQDLPLHDHSHLLIRV